jgi:membrane associated rhomboid family serine protease
MLIWYVLCVIGVIPHVANWAHGGGLLAGIAIAFSDTSFKRLLRQK